MHAKSRRYLKIAIKMCVNLHINSHVYQRSYALQMYKVVIASLIRLDVTHMTLMISYSLMRTMEILRKMVSYLETRRAIKKGKIRLGYLL